MGPHLLNLVDMGAVRTLLPLTEFALALIMFDIGTNFSFKRLGKQGRRLTPLIIGDIGLTFTLVFLAVWVFSSNPSLALLLGILAIATAPATTLLVLKEYDAEGPVTDSLITLVGINNVVCIIAFEFALVLISPAATPVGTLSELGGSGLTLLLSIGIAAFGGVVVSYLEQKVSGPERLILFLGIVAAAYGVCNRFNLPFMLVFLVMGVSVRNTSEFAKEIIGELDRVGWPLYVLFFAVAGAKLQVDRLAAVGLVSVVYLFSRAAGKIGGIRFAARFTGNFSVSAKEISWGMLSQAGVAIGLAMLAVKRLPDIGSEVETVIVSTIVVFELLGAPLAKISVVRAGEVKVLALLDRPSESLYHLSLRRLFRNLSTRVGLLATPYPRNLEDVRVSHLMRKNVRTISIAATFPEILSFIAGSRQHYFPVTREENNYEGLISYPEIREVIYDPNLTRIMIAKDFVRYREARIGPGASLEEAMDKFNDLNMDSIPVVEDESGKLVGILDQREVLSLYCKRRIENI